MIQKFGMVKKIGSTYKLYVIYFDSSVGKTVCNIYSGRRVDLIDDVVYRNIRLLNSTIQAKDRLYVRKVDNKMEEMRMVAREVRKYIEEVANNGGSIEQYSRYAAEILDISFKIIGVQSKISCGECRYRIGIPHYWNEIRSKNGNIFIDVTADQFNCYIPNKRERFSGIIIRMGIPENIVYRDMCVA